MAKAKKYQGHDVVSEGLVETQEPGFDKPVFRRPGFNGVLSFDAMEKALSEQTRASREMRGLTRENLASVLGLSTQVFRRYEVAFSKMHVTRLIHICEILDVSPFAMIVQAAPHLFGKTPQEAETRAQAIAALEQLPENSVALLLPLLQALQNKPGHSSVNDAEVPAANLSELADLDRMSGRRSSSVPKKDPASGGASGSKPARMTGHASEQKRRVVARKS
ncbi:helix-turn-helix transcriptional regulator [Mesorhizobium sp. Cs1299R1N1]|uniref:helix-turn-helix domain-containing protein n=1 Tax=Mesorhizobium sp. Cs1299R1N1 TaxID=3015172 RepID=UPI00301D5A4F